MISVRILLEVLLLAGISHVAAEKTHDGVSIGIDLGTTYVRVGTFRNGRFEIISDLQGSSVTPSYVAFTPEGKILIGYAAKAQASSNPQNTVFNVKRLIGRTWDDRALQKDIKYLPYIVVNKNGKILIQVDLGGEHQEFTPEEISAMLLMHMKKISEEYLGQKVTSAVLTVPAYFNNAQRQATKDAGKMAGLNILRVMNEPTAAVLAYEVKRKSTHESKTILVYDLGGGSFDVSIVYSEDGLIDVLATRGDTHLGGEDFNQRIIGHLIKDIKKRTGHGINGNYYNPKLLHRLRQKAERAKRTLSSKNVASIDIENVVSGVDLSEKLSAAKFEELNKNLFESTFTMVQKAMDDSGLGKEDINEVFFVGGSTKIPMLQLLVRDYFGREQIQNKAVYPEEAVAYGAAVQAAILNRKKNIPYDMTVIDIVPRSLGIEKDGGVMLTIIQRGTKIPILKNGTTNYIGIGKNPTLGVFEGDHQKTKYNHLLTKFDLTGIHSGSMINVTFNVDPDGILNGTVTYMGRPDSRPDNQPESRPDNQPESQSDSRQTTRQSDALPDSIYFRVFKWVVAILFSFIFLKVCCQTPN